MKCNPNEKFLGYYYGLGRFLAQHPNGGVPGNCFINGETLSLWIWDKFTRQWIDSNRPDNWLRGMVDNATTFVPQTKPGVKTAYLYVTNQPGTITFTHFLNDGVPLTVKIEVTSMVILFWTGDYWEYSITPMGLAEYEALDKYLLKDLSNISASSLREKIGAFETFVIEYTIDIDHAITIETSPSVLTQIWNALSQENEVTLYFATNDNNMGPAIAPASAGAPLAQSASFSAVFTGADHYIHQVFIDTDGTVTKQYAFSLEDFVTKQEIEDLNIGNLSGLGYLPTRIIDLGEYNNGMFSLKGSNVSDIISSLRSVVNGSAHLLLRAESQFGEPVTFQGVTVDLSSDTQYELTFILSTGESYSIHIDEDYPDEITQGAAQGNGSLTASTHSDTHDYNEI